MTPLCLFNACTLYGPAMASNFSSFTVRDSVRRRSSLYSTRTKRAGRLRLRVFDQAVCVRSAQVNSSEAQVVHLNLRERYAAYFSREMTLGTEIIKFPLIPATFPAFMEINYVHRTHIHTLAFFHTHTR